MLHTEKSQLGVDLFHGHTALQILELLSNDGGFLPDAVDGCKEKRCGFFFFKKKSPEHLQTENNYTSDYKRLSFLWVPGNSSIKHS